MKRIFLAGCVMVFVFASGYGYAQMDGGGMMGGQKGDAGQQQGMMMDEGMSSMMNQMMGQGMIVGDMMRMMMDMMKMQKKTMAGAKPAEAKEMMMQMDGMMMKMDKMMSMGMMGAGASGSGLKCAEEWLKKAIDLHEVHIADPKTATDASQMEMMDQMKRAYGCITTGAAEPMEGMNNSAQAQEKSEAGVAAKVSLLDRDGTLAFKVVLDTHSVELDKYKFDEIVVLRADGKEYKAKVKSQEGSGHHRSAVVEFDNPKGKEITVIIKGVAGVGERAFKF